MRRRQIIECVACIVLMCLCGGCVGVVVTGDSGAAVNGPNISKEKGYIGHTPLAPDTYVTETELLQYWGTPDEVKFNDKGQKQLLYKRNAFRWNGITLMVIIPIPLIIPVGHDFLLFTVENGNVASAYMKNNSGELGLYCWIGPLFHPADWCNARANIGAIEDVPLPDFVASQESLIR
jgi:hypothetical protein